MIVIEQFKAVDHELGEAVKIIVKAKMLKDFRHCLLGIQVKREYLVDKLRLVGLKQGSD